MAAIIDVANGRFAFTAISQIGAYRSGHGASAVSHPNKPRDVYAVAGEAVALMKTHRLEPSPQTYEVVMCHLMQANPAVSAEIERLLAEGAFNEEAAIALYEEHFSELRLTAHVVEAGERIGRELQGALQSLEEAEQRTIAYGETLEGASSALERENDPRQVRVMVDGLLVATRQMEEHSRDLERQLTETSSEVSNLRAALDQARQEAMTDALTGISNRKAFDLELARLVGIAETGGPSFSLVLADIDHFKRVNDVWGHQTGDQVIRFVASVLERVAGPGHLVARYGGEEFAILMQDVTVSKAVMLCEEARRLVEGKKLVRRSTNEELGQITISSGVTAFGPGERARALVERADVALYESKRNGRNQVTSKPAPPASSATSAAA